MVDTKNFDQPTVTWKLVNYPKHTKLSHGTIRRYIHEAFAKWSAVIPVDFESVSGEADITLGFYGSDWYPAFKHETGGTSGVWLGAKRAIGFNIHDNWVDSESGFEKDYYGTFPNTRDRSGFRRVCVHEIGHALGLSHGYVKDTVMKAGESQEHLQPDDIERIIALYGPRHGRLKFYRDNAQDGTARWAPSGNEIGHGWDVFRLVTGGYDGKIYAINGAGHLMFYRDLAANGRAHWLDGSGKKIGSGWGVFRSLLGGWEGKLYAIRSDGTLHFYRDQAQDGSAKWLNGGGRKIGSGWQRFSTVFGGWQGKIYAIEPDGDLYFYQDQAQDGRAQWLNGGGKKIGTGWNRYRKVFGGWDGKIYAITGNGDLHFYRDQAQDGTADWLHETGRKIGGGWHIFGEVFGGADGKIYAIT